MTIRELLARKVKEAMLAAGLPPQCNPAVAPGKNAAFGDYQANGAMAAAKLTGSKPRELAGKIVSLLDLGEIADRVEIAGPGFINIHLNADWLATQLTDVPQRPEAAPAETIVVDYSGPNLAKEMHVGHLRSTIIGDAMVRVLEYLGHKVIRQNHVGDWGTQFGMLIAELENQVHEGEAPELALADLEVFYQNAKKHFDDDENFAALARDYVVRLQSGEPAILAQWQNFRRISLEHSAEVYALLNVSLTPADVRGESFYNDDLPVLVEELRQQGLAVTDQGAQVVFLPELADRKGNPSPVIVQKQDGGFLYATSDLAAVRFRANQLGADRIMVFSDARQSLHMQQVYTVARKAGFAATSLKLEHHPFGTMMGPDGRPFKTRTGGTVKLAELLREAIERAAVAVAAKNPDLPEADRAIVARKVGIGAVKYADLCKTRTNDYIFDWDQMLKFEGNTGPYLQYAYTRVRSIFRKAELSEAQDTQPLFLVMPEEKSLAIKLLQFGEVLENMADDALPHLLCTYLYDLASLFSQFYEACPILKDGVSSEARASRLQLCAKVAATLERGLGLLGIEVMDRM